MVISAYCWIRSEPEKSRNLCVEGPGEEMKEKQGGEVSEVGGGSSERCELELGKGRGCKAILMVVTLLKRVYRVTLEVTDRDIT